MTIEPRYRELFERLTMDDITEVAGWVDPAFPPRLVTPATLLRLPRVRVELLEVRTRKRREGEGGP